MIYIYYCEIFNGYLEPFIIGTIYYYSFMDHYCAGALLIQVNESY